MCNMTVKELIEQLKQYDDDLPVCLKDWPEESDILSLRADDAEMHALREEFDGNKTYNNGHYICLTTE